MIKKIIFVLISCTLIMCIDPIDLVDSDQAQSFIAISAKASKTTQRGTIEVDIFQTSYLTDRSFGLIVNEVSIINSKGQKLQLQKILTGKYRTVESNDFKLVDGEKYKIYVKNGQDVFESEFMTLTPAPNILDKSFDFSTNPDDIAKGNTGRLGVNINTIFNETHINKILKWDVLRSSLLTEQEFGEQPGRKCYLLDNKDDKLNIKLLDARKFNTNDSFNVKVAQRGVNDVFAEGAYYTIIQESINFDTYKYFLAYNNLVSREGTIFETPPGPLPSNFKCLNDTTKAISGFFYVTHQDTARIFIDPNKVGNPARLCPVPPVEFNPCPVVQCCDCLKLKNATLIKPFYWN